MEKETQMRKNKDGRWDLITDQEQEAEQTKREHMAIDNAFEIIQQCVDSLKRKDQFDCDELAEFYEYGVISTLKYWRMHHKLKFFNENFKMLYNEIDPDRKQDTALICGLAETAVREKVWNDFKNQC